MNFYAKNLLHPEDMKYLITYNKVKSGNKNYQIKFMNPPYISERFEEEGIVANIYKEF